MECRLPLDETGNWRELRRPEAAPAWEEAALRPALFLDRDGVLVEDVGYLHRPEDLRLLPGAAESLSAARQAGLALVLVTNQSGVGRGLYGWAEFRDTQEALYAALTAAGAPPDGGLDLVLACPHHPQAKDAYRMAEPFCRKPRPGLLLQAARLLPIALSRSWMVGDRTDDLRAAAAAGLAGGLLLAPEDAAGAAERQAAEALARPDFAVRLAHDHGGVAALVAALAPLPGTRKA